MYLSTLNDLKYYVDELSIEGNERLMIFVGDGCEKEVNEMINFLNSKNILFFGGIYSRLLVGDRSLSKGYIVQKVEPIYCSMILPNLMRFVENLDEDEEYVAIVIADGLSSSYKALTDTLYSKLGNSIKYIGGGAGFYNLNHKPCIFDNDGVTKDSLYVCVVKAKAQIAVEHGWRIIKGPFRVTASNSNVLLELDGFNAFEKYKEILEDETGLTIYKSDFFTYAKEYPFGIMNGISMDVIVRDPITVNDDLNIVCVADIPMDSNLCILSGNVKTLLEASLIIAEKCSKEAPKKYRPILFDCISRAMFLEENFLIELANIQNRMNCTVEGVLSIGEVSSKVDGSIVIHNKSTVLGLLERN
ncbi:FIST N-terminal domain-containing protein [Clostridium sp. YIM B02555]|uniref:FIST signal transduction protein n=1 Tax=Clostridium sp. YIM B02555 TaxID=2911968 RepID=UPI001EED8D40|nr:FIST N-terminal domain-containing protein [Clostridium sp. YIM B02555]